MVRRFLAIVLVVTTFFLVAPRPTYAGGLTRNPSNNYYMEYSEPSSNFLENCWKGEPKNMLEGIICGSIEGGIVTLGSAGVAVGICYAADAVATSVFPPAAALAPVCMTAGVAGAGAVTGGSNLVKQGIKAFAH